MADGKVLLVDAPAAFKASVWKTFGFAATRGPDGLLSSDRTKVVCKVCHVKLKYSGNTTNLHTHIIRHHPELKLSVKEPATRDSDRTDSHMKLMQHTSACSKSQKTLTFSFSNVQRSADITLAIGKFIVKDLRPYSVVESEGFQHMMRVLQPQYQIPSRKHFSDRVIPNMYNEKKLELQQTLKSAQHVSLTTDGWTSRSTVSYITITCHFIDNQWNMRNVVLQTRPLCESHTAANIAKVLENAAQEWGFENKVVALVTDNASNMVKAAREAKMKHIGCFAHTLNLSSQKSLKVVSKVLASIRRVVGYFHRSAKATAILREKQALLNLPEHKLKQDVATRWNSSYDMVKRYLEQQPAVQATLLSKEIRRGDLPGSLDETELSVAEDIVQVMQPMKSATVALCDEKEPTLSIVGPLYHRMLKVSSDSSEGSRQDNSEVMQDMQKAIHDDLVNRYPDQSLLKKSSALDPRFKGLNFLTDGEKLSVFADIAIEAAGLPQMTRIKHEPQVLEVDQPLPNLPHLPDLTDEEDVSVAVTVNDEEQKYPVGGPSQPKQAKMSEPDVKEKKCALDDLLGEVFVTKFEEGVKSRVEMANDEVNKYKEMASIPLSSNPLMWWRENAYMFPMLSELAKKYLSVPGTSVPSERVFSTAGDILTASRASLKSQHVDMLLFLKKNLKL